MVTFAPLPRPVWTPPPVLPNASSDDPFEVAAAFLGLGGVKVFPGTRLAKNGRRKTFKDIQRLPDFRRQRPDAVFGIRLGGGVVAIETPAGGKADRLLDAISERHGDLPRTVTLAAGGCSWRLYRTAETPQGRVALGDGAVVLGCGCGLPLPPSPSTWLAGAAPGEIALAMLPGGWESLWTPKVTATTARWF